jgi:SNF2 family DNA or RNA helicase
MLWMGASSSADVRNIQAPFRAGIDIEDYQLDPVVRAIQMPRVNLLIADDVGLGKTIESGMVALELIIRHRARKILIVCPASLQVQWKEQMRDKFGLDFRIVDSNLTMPCHDCEAPDPCVTFLVIGHSLIFGGAVVTSKQKICPPLPFLAT